MFNDTRTHFCLALSKLRGDAPLTTFVHAMFKNKCADYPRSVQHQLVDQLDDEGEIVSAHRCLCDRLSQKEVLGFLAECIAHFHRKHPQRAQTMHVFNLECSTADISDRRTTYRHCAAVALRGSHLFAPLPRAASCDQFRQLTMAAAMFNEELELLFLNEWPRVDDLLTVNCSSAPVRMASAK